MTDPLMYKQDYFVILETNQPEQIVTVQELLEKLVSVLQQRQLAELPQDLQKFDTPQTQAKYLLDTSCELDMGPGEYLQWYAIRLEK